MKPESSGASPRKGGCLAGARAWIITDGKAGMDVQAKGVAEALGLAYEMKHVAPKGLWKLTAPWGPVDPRERFGEPGSLFASPWPVVAIATGRASIPYIRALRRKAGVGTYCIVLQDPKTGAGTADLIWVPEHDRRRGPNVITTLTAPHNFSAVRLAELRRTLPPEVAALPSPRVTVALGGKNGIYKFTEADDDRLKASLKSIGDAGASFLVTVSRRTHQRLIRAVGEATRDRPRILWDGTGANPYPFFLAAADWLVVTADSVNMTGEACATGKPVYVFEPSGGSAKFRRFHEALQRHGATRPLPAVLHALEQWRYEPLDSAAVIAAEAERRYSRRSQMLSGLMARQTGAA
jgi:mitochondrial fission protein ELM1